LYVMKQIFTRFLLFALVAFTSKFAFGQKPNLTTKSSQFRYNADQRRADIKVVVTNNGMLKNGDFKVGIFISDDMDITTSDSMFYQSGLWDMTPGDSLSVAVNAYSLPFMPQGDYFIGYIIDFENAVDESNEDDNTGVFSDTITYSSASIQQSVVPPLSLYPNPVSELLTVTNTEPGCVMVYNIHGVKCLEQNVKRTEHQLDCSQLPTGNYILEFKSDSGLKRSRVVIKSN